jgi:hypothetical protein
LALNIAKLPELLRPSRPDTSTGMPVAPPELVTPVAVTALA